MLGSNTILDSGSTFTITNLAAGQYDLWAAPCDDDDRSRDYSRSLPQIEFEISISGEITYTLSPNAISSSGGVTFTVVNDSNSTACYVYLSPSTDDFWGPDLIGPASDGVSSGDSLDITNVPPTTYDILIENCNNNTVVEFYGIDVNGNTSWNVSSGQ